VLGVNVDANGSANRPTTETPLFTPYNRSQSPLSSFPSAAAATVVPVRFAPVTRMTLISVVTKGGHDADTLNTNRQGEPDRSYENRARALNGPRGSSPSRHSPAVATSAKGRPAAIRESGPGGRHSSSTSAKGAVENQARPGRSEQVVQLVCSSSGPPYLGSTQSARASGEPLSRSPIIVASAPSGWLRCCETMVGLRGPRANGQGCAERSGFHDAKLLRGYGRPFRLLRPYGIWACWEHDPGGTGRVIPGHGEVT